MARMRRRRVTSESDDNRRVFLGLALWALALILNAAAGANTGDESEAYCFNAGARNAWDCDLVEQSGGPLMLEYHTLKVVLPDAQDGAVLDRVLPIERIGEFPLPSGETVVFLGRFRDSMKAFRVVEKCQQAHAGECSRFSPEVVRIGGRGKETAQDTEVKVAALDLQAKTSGDLVNMRVVSLDLPEGSMDNSGINSSIEKRQPDGLIQLPRTTKHVLWVDLNEGNLYVLERDGDQYRLRESMSVSIGKLGFGKVRKGDQKTPVGVYRLMSRLSDERLDDFYGNGAFTLNYPNALDRIRERTGSGIWLHGLPKGKDHRPLQDSDGCVVLSNAMIDGLGKYIDLQRTPIVLDDRMKWIDVAGKEALGQELTQTIEAWRQAWSALDNDTYLGYYASDFTDFKKDLAAWKKYKRRIHRNKSFVKVHVSELSLLAYPGERDTVIARFYQRYKSNNYRESGWKEQLWRKEESGQWRIVYERG